MNDDVYFNVPGVAVVRWDMRAQAAHMEWQGWATPVEFRAANDALVEAIKGHRGTKLLGDSRKIRVIKQESRQ